MDRTLFVENKQHWSFRVIGFEDMGGNDNFPTELLERRLQKKGNFDCFNFSGFTTERAFIIVSQGILPRQNDEDNSDEDEDGKKKKSLFRRGNNYDDDSD